MSITATNLWSTRTGAPVANQIEIEQKETDKKWNLKKHVITFQSYRSQICDIDQVKQIIYIYKDWDYSNTTRIYFNQFLTDNGLRFLYDEIKTADKNGVKCFETNGNYTVYFVK